LWLFTLAHSKSTGNKLRASLHLCEVDVLRIDGFCVSLPEESEGSEGMGLFVYPGLF